MTIHFVGCLVDSQLLGSDNEHVVSKIFFIIDETPYETIVRQPYGSNRSFETEPLEVENPKRLRGKMDYGAFRDVAEQYYRMLIGSQGSAININNSSNIRIMDTKIWQSWTVMIPDIKDAGGW